MNETEIIHKLNSLAYGRKLSTLLISNGMLYASFENEDDNDDDVQVCQFANGDLMELLRDALGYDMPAIVRQNQQLKQTVARLQEANARMAELLFADNEQDTNGYTVAALVAALCQYAKRENWTRDAEIEYSIDDYVEAGSVRLNEAVVWKCGGPGYTIAQAALNGDLVVTE